MSVTKKVNSRKRTSHSKGTRGGWLSNVGNMVNNAGAAVGNAVNDAGAAVGNVAENVAENVVNNAGNLDGGKSRKSSKKSLRRKSLVHKKKRCPKYCRRKSVRCKSYRPVRKSRKHR